VRALVEVLAGQGAPAWELTLAEPAAVSAAPAV
jgi:hypothetical protein